MEKISRKQAIEKGLTTYYTGKACHKGHIDYRYVCDHACAECARIKANKYRNKNPEKVQEQRSRWKERYHAEPHIREKAIADSARWVAENKEKAKKYQRDYHQKNREKRLAQSKEYVAEKRKNPEWVEKERVRTAKKKKENPEAYRSYVRARAARRKNAEGNHSGDDVLKILRSQGYRCVYCKVDISNGYDVDHIVPLAKGGSNWPENLQCLCPKCNGRKWAKCPIQFAKEMGILI